MFVIGTAGHVDHGKSALIEALTGTHPDRLREEQARGMTIELGFGWLTLPSGREVSIVDVPGHVRFVRHMLAGIGAVDLALLVVAADEGVMPQTREHLEILDLLDVSRAIVVLTKCDLVDGEWADLVEQEVEDVLAGTSLAGSPLLRVSSATGAGLDALRAAIDEALADTPPPRDIGRPRLGIDRVFTMPGFGTVVTGTLLDGPLRTGDTIEVTPGGPTARVRGLQMHRRDVAEATPGSRVAVNLAGVPTEDLGRGQVLAPPGRVPAVRTFDARVRALADRPLPHNLRVAVHVGAAEAQGRVRVLRGAPGDAAPVERGHDTGPDGQIAAGEEGWAQVVLLEPLAALAGDLFVLRVSDETVAGGRIVEVNPPRHRRSDEGLVERLVARAAGTAESRVLAALEHIEPATAATLVAEVDLAAAEMREALGGLVAEGVVRELPIPGGDALLLTASGLARFASAARSALTSYLGAHPLRFAMPREELRGALRLPAREFNAVLGGLTPDLEARGEGIAEASWTPAPTPQQQREIDEVARALIEGGMQPPRLRIDAEIFAHLEGAGRIVDCGDGVVLSAEAYTQAREGLVTLLRQREEVTLAEARDALGTNRRAAQAILEMFDRQGVTRRRGETRVLQEAEARASADGA